VVVAGERTGRRHRVRWWIIGAVVVVAVLAAGGPFVYIHFIEGPAPPKLALPPARTGGRGNGASSQGSGAGAGTVPGTWNVGAGSLVGYRVNEVLIGQNSTAVGRTTEVSGSVVISGTSVTAGQFTVDMASVTSDQSERNAQFDGRIMDVAQYPTATLVLSEPSDLGSIPAVGTTARYSATGDLTMHGVTKPVTFAVSGERSGQGIDILADLTVRFAEWNIANPSIGGLVTTSDQGTLEALIELTRGTGNPQVSGASGSAPSGPGAGVTPVTVPRTTVPPLTIPPKTNS
jgi:polyisoprenoid-binding protein YceI